MRARLQAWLEAIGDQFWLRPAAIVLFCIAMAQSAVWIDTAGVFDASSSSARPWGYSGGAEGARVLLGAVASSSIGVASTIFSITIAALTLASGQMGPRLLRNFVRDGRNQLALGIFVGTFAYALVVLRTVRTEQEGMFIPHAAVTGAIVLALICVATLVWFVHHIATSINVEKVVDAVHADLISAVEAGTSENADLACASFQPGQPIAVPGSNYLQAVDLSGLADWAAKTQTKILLRVRPGDYIPQGLPVAEVLPARDDAQEALARALTFGRQPAALQDLEYSVRQLTEIAVRALSPGINDPFTAGSVLERFGDALCRIAKRSLSTGALARYGKIVLQHPVTDYEGLCDAMFLLIRQNASNSAYILIRLMDVLTKVAEVERMTDRLEHLSRHADRVVAAGKHNLSDQAAIADLVHRHKRLCAAVEGRAVDRRQSSPKAVDAHS
jgi:uncharacterized membrane protein